MKTLKRIKLINWNEFINTDIIIGENITILGGKSGAGKSTILDAVLYVITCSYRHFNIAANEDSKRNINSYVRGKVGKEGKSYLRSGFITSHIALEIYDDKTDKYFIIGAVLDSFTETDIKRYWYKIEDCQIHNELFLQGNIPKKREVFSATTENIKTYKDSSEAKKEIRNRLGRYPEKIYDLLVRALAIKPIKKVNEFFTTYLLDEKELDVSSIRETLNDFKNLEYNIQQTKEKISKLEKIGELYSQLKKHRENKNIEEYIARRAEIDETQDKIDNLLTQIDNNEGILEFKNKESISAKEILSNLNKTIQDLKSDINENEELKQIQEYSDKIKDISFELEQLNLQYNKLNTLVDKSIEASSELLRMDITLDFIKDYKDSLIDFKNTDNIERLAISIKKYSNQARELNLTKTQEYGQLKNEKEKNENALTEVNNKISELEKKNLQYDPSVTKLIEAIKRDFKTSGKDDEPRVLCELLQITDESWANAIEGYIVTQKFNILVKPENFNLALSTYENLRKKTTLHSVGIINAEGLEKHTNCDEGTLASLIESDNPYAKMYINKLLGKVVLCDEVNDLKKHSTSITRNCMVYKNNVASAINPNKYKTPFIGADAYKVQLEQALQEKSELTHKVKELELSLVGTKKYIELLANEYEKDINRHMEVIPTIKSLTTKKNEFEERKNVLESKSNAFEKLELISIKEKEYEEKESAYINLVEEIGKLKGKIEQDKINYNIYENSIKDKMNRFNEVSKKISNQLDVAESRYDKVIMSGKTFSQIVASVNSKISGIDSNIDKKKDELNSKQTEYKILYQFGGESSEAGYYQFEDELYRLKETALIEYEEKAIMARKEAEIEFREQFLSNLRENIKIAQSEMERLNHVLKSIKFGGDRYQFIYKRSEELGTYYDMIMDELNMLEGYSLLSGGFNDKYKDTIEELFLKISEFDEASEEIKILTDYRQYMDYDIVIHHQDSDKTYFSKVNGNKSGGETQNVIYVCIAASFVQAYSQGIGGIEDSLPLVMFDEAFAKMDDSRIAGVMGLLKQLPLQVIIATPVDKLSDLAPKADDVILVKSLRHKGYINNFSKQEIDQLIEEIDEL